MMQKKRRKKGQDARAPSPEPRRLGTAWMPPPEFAPIRFSHSGAVAALSIELARENTLAEIGVCVMKLGALDRADEASEVATFHQMADERAGSIEFFVHGINPQKTRLAPGEEFAKSSELATRLENFVSSAGRGAILTGDRAHYTYMALRAVYPMRVPFFVHDLRYSSDAAGAQGAASKGYSHQKPDFSHMLEEELLADPGRCEFHKRHDPAFRCALARARAVARVIRRCWRGEFGPTTLPVVPKPKYRCTSIVLPSDMAEAEEMVLFAAALRGKEIAISAFLLLTGEVAQACVQIDEKDQSSVTKALTTLRALTGGSTCLLASSGDGESLSKRMLQLEMESDEDYWLPSFFMVEPGTLRFATHSSKRLQSDIEEFCRQAQDTPPLCCDARHTSPTQCALAASRTVALGVRAAWAHSLAKENSSLAERLKHLVSGIPDLRSGAEGPES